MRTWTSMFVEAAGGDNLAVIDTQETDWTGRELIRQVAGSAAWLDASHIPSGFVPAVLSSTPAALAVAFAGAMTGRPLALLSPRHTERELHDCLAGLGGDNVLADHGSHDLMRPVAASLGRRIVVLDEVSPADRLLEDRCGQGDVVFVLHTSGTTGLPKPVPVRNLSLGARARTNASLLGLGPGDRYATSTGFHHISGLGGHAAALAAGATTIVSRQYRKEEWTAWAELGVTHALLVPTMISDLVETGALATPTLRCLEYGAAPIQPEALSATLAALPGVDLVQFYGQTEGTPIAVLTAADHRAAANGHPTLLETVGRPAPGVELRIAAPDEAGIGEIMARADHLFVRDAQGWLATGDLGHLDDEGYLHLVGRRGDKIIRGGENVYPAEVERVLSEHPRIADVAVCGVPDARLGEVVKAYVVAVDQRALPDVDELRLWTRTQLAGFKVPTAWTFLDELPRNAGGKVLRRQLTANENIGAKTNHQTNHHLKETT